MAKENGEDMTRNDVLFPPRLKNAHDTAIRQKKWKEDEKRRSQFINRYKELCGFCYSSEGLSIHPAATENEMIIEGKLLKHCVATYAKRYADGETSIFFIRHEDKPYEPYLSKVAAEKPRDNQHFGRILWLRNLYLALVMIFLFLP